MSGVRWVLSGKALASAPRALLGGKGQHLARLQGLGQPVPPFYVVTTEACTAAAGAFPSELLAAMEQAHTRTIPEGAYVAVRSSAADEDAPGHSFAGLHDSVLFVRGGDALREAILRVWASGRSERAVAYRRRNGLPDVGTRMAVVVQQMIDPAVSGVVFTADPLSGDPHLLLVSAVFGAGEGLVSAGFDADSFTVHKASLAVTPRIVSKDECLVFDTERAQGLRREGVPEPLRTTASLDDEQLREIVRHAVDIENGFHRPQDIEFCYDRSGRLAILQSRPITTVAEYGPAAGNRLIWDNSNIVESYAGVTSPMTFSFIRRSYTIVYHCFASVMGIAPHTVRANQGTFENMLGLIRGRVYYNLLNWYRLVALFPGFHYNRRFMESMMGVRQPASLKDETPSPSFRQRFLVELPALVRLLLRSCWNFLTIERHVAEFERHFKLHHDRWAATDVRRLAPHEMRQLYTRMEDALLWNWKAPIINDFFVMIAYGLLRKLCARWCDDRAGSLQNDLLCGEGGIESTEPTKMLLRLAGVARQDPALRALLASGRPEELPEQIASDPRFHDFHEGVQEYLRAYGFRCMNELKLEEPSLRDRPEFLFRVLRNYVALDDPSAIDVDLMEAHERRIRAEAETRAFARLGPLRARIFRIVLAAARLGVKNRENMRFARTRIFGLMREMLRALGDLWTEEGVLEQTSDIFYLTLDEVWDFTRGTAVTADLRSLASVRRAEFDRYRREEAPDERFETWGSPYHRNLFKRRGRSDRVPEDGVLRGVGCCPGEREGVVKVVRSPNDDLHLRGEILATERTDPGWVPLYPSISGLLIERGSILSHSAIVAREMGLPTIVGIPGLLLTVNDGDTVAMDGSAGTARVVRAEMPVAAPSAGDRQER